jgi:hypothetical protein
MSLEPLAVIGRTFGTALVVLLAGASQAVALPLRDIGQGTVWTDGDRYAVFYPHDEANRPRMVLDERTGRRYPLSAPTVPPASGFTTPVACRFNGLAAGQVLWACDYGDPPFLLTELATGESRAVPGWAELDSSLSQFPFLDNIWVRDMGRRWLLVQGYSWAGLDANRWLDWRTGRLVTDPAAGARTVFDLDDPRLSVPLCTPLRRRVEPYEGVGPDSIVPYVYEGGWLFEPFSFPQHRPVVIRRCGRHRRLVLHACRHRCGSATMGAGYVSWFDRKQFSRINQPPVSKDRTLVFAYDLGRRRPLRFQANFDREPPDFVWHTRRHIYANGQIGQSRIWVGRLPGEP